jgi:hypothetical protein
VAGVLAGWFVWAQFQGTGPSWTQADLVARARAGQVAKVTITDDSAVAVGRDGARHGVHLSGDIATTVSELSADGVDVTFQPGSTQTFWVSVLLPNAMLLALVGLTGLVIVVVARQRRPAPAR